MYTPFIVNSFVYFFTFYLEGYCVVRKKQTLFSDKTGKNKQNVTYFRGPVSQPVHKTPEKRLKMI